MIAVVDVGEELGARLHAPGTELRVIGADELAGVLTSAPEAVVVGPRHPKPIAIAQAIRSVDKLVSVLVLVDASRLTALSSEALATPFLGRNVTFRSTDEPALAELLSALAESTHERRRYARLIESARTPFDDGAPPWRGRSRRHLGALLEHAPFGAALLDAAGTVVGMNRQALELLGRPRRSVGHAFVELLDPVHRDEWSLALDGSARTEKGLVLPVRDEQGRRIVAFVAREGGAGDDAGWLLIMHDVTEQELAREERRLAERRALESQYHETVGLLAGGVAHDFNNLLTVVMATLDTLAHEERGGTTRHGQITSALGAVHAAAHLVRQLLAYSGQGMYVMGDVDLPTFLRDVRPFLVRGLRGDHPLDLEIEATSAVVRADRTSLQQLLFNLLQNADEAMGDRTGPLVLSLRLETAPGGRVDAALRVLDTGDGMEESVRRRAYEPFFTTKGIGRGLGLSAVRGLTEALGGTIELDSRPGRGTTVTVRLPVVEPKAGRV